MDWNQVTQRIMSTFEPPSLGGHTRQTTRRGLDAHAIANRILRRDNYLIALFNKDVLDLSFPLLSKDQNLTKIVEWSLSYCILSFVFDDRGQIKKRFLKDVNRGRLALG